MTIRVSCRQNSKNQKIKGSSYFLFIFWFLFFVLAVWPALAQEEANTDSESPEKVSLDSENQDNQERATGNIEVIADLNIRNTKLSEIKKNHLKLSFELRNSMATQSDLIYGLELIKKQKTGKSIYADIVVFWNDKVTVRQDETVKREIEYLAPANLDGDYIMWLKVKNESGLVLALRHFDVNFAGLSSDYLEQSQCYFSIKEEPDQKYNLDQGVDVRVEENLILNCQVQNFSEQDLTAKPFLEFYRRNFFGPTISRSEQAEITVLAGQTQATQTVIPLTLAPQAYDVKLILKKEDSIISNPVIAHFVVAGESASITNMVIDKTEYRAGETIKINLLWNASADTFLDSRTGGTSLDEPLLEIEIKNQDNKELCATKQVINISNYKESVEIVAEKACLDPIVTASVVNQGRTLYSKTIRTQAEPEPESKNNSKDDPIVTEAPVPYSNNRSTLIIVFLLLAILIISLIVFWRWQRKNKSAGRSLFMALILFGSLAFFAPTKALATTILYGDPALQLTVLSNLYGTTWVDIANCSSQITNYSSLPTCNRNTCTAATNTPCLKTSPSPGFYCRSVGKKKGCYRDVVSFTYDLTDPSGNGTPFDRGTTIIAEGTATGLNVCENGVTAGIAVEPKNIINTAEWVLSPIWFNDSDPNSGSYSFGTSGWSCTNYTAEFILAFKHGTTTNLATDYSKVGTDTFDYSLTNCCASTCPTSGRPGCSGSSVSNAHIDSDYTCCSGSCYACNDDTYWTGSVCTAYACTGTPPNGSTQIMCPSDNTDLTRCLPWLNRGTASGNCTDGRKCEYYEPPPTCTGNAPNGTDQIMCPNDNTSLSTSLSWSNIGSTSSSCTDTRKCEYYEPPLACNAACSAHSRCTSGYCYNGSCRNSTCQTEIDCFCDINGACATPPNGEIYPAGTTGYPVGTTFCTAGTSSPPTPAFPARGGPPVIWDCLGANGGTNANPRCTATRYGICTGTAPDPSSHTEAWDAEESESVPADRPWGYSASDDINTKCQYKCQYGYQRINGVCQRIPLTCTLNALPAAVCPGGSVTVEARTTPNSGVTGVEQVQTNWSTSPDIGSSPIWQISPAVFTFNLTLPTDNPGPYTTTMNAKNSFGDSATCITTSHLLAASCSVPLTYPNGEDLGDILPGSKITIKSNNSCFSPLNLDAYRFLIKKDGAVADKGTDYSDTVGMTEVFQSLNPVEIEVHLPGIYEVEVTVKKQDLTADINCDSEFLVNTEATEWWERRP